MDDWKVANGRVTLFPQMSAQVSQTSPIELYRAVWGTDPDNYQKQPNPMLPSTAQGRQGKVAATCVVQSTRIDFNLTPAVPDGTLITRNSFPLFDDLKPVRRETFRIIDALGLEQFSKPIIRVGLYVQMVKLARDAADANRILTSSMPKQYAPDLTNEEDFILQINRPYQSEEVPRMRMNAIQKWSVDRIQIVTYSIPGPIAQIPAPSGNPVPAAPQTENLTTASITFDLNNPPPDSALPSAEQVSLLREATKRVIELQRNNGVEENNNDRSLSDRGISPSAHRT